MGNWFLNLGRDQRRATDLMKQRLELERRRRDGRGLDAREEAKLASVLAALRRLGIGRED